MYPQIEHIKRQQDGRKLNDRMNTQHDMLPGLVGEIRFLPTVRVYLNSCTRTKSLLALVP